MIDSKPSEISPKVPVTSDQVPWNPWIAVIFAILIYLGSQVAGYGVAIIYPTLLHWNSAQAADWIQGSIVAQFVYIASAAGFTIGAIYLYVRKQGARLALIGLRRPRWRDLAYGLMAVPFYYGIYLLTVALVSNFVPSLNVNQAQEIGFSDVHGAVALILTFTSLVILPAVTEEILFRGFLYSSLKKGLPTIAAVLVTSAIFAGAHLPEGGAAGPLYIAAIDTFILSLVMIYLREKTGSLWASITLHAIKNGVAFVALFILQVY